MLDDDSRRTKAVRAALELARERDWGDISLSDIAQAAGLTLADLRREFTWKSDILKAFQAAVDTEVLTKVETVRRRRGCPSRERSQPNGLLLARGWPASAQLTAGNWTPKASDADGSDVPTSEVAGR